MKADETGLRVPRDDSAVPPIRPLDVTFKIVLVVLAGQFLLIQGLAILYGDRFFAAAFSELEMQASFVKWDSVKKIFTFTEYAFGHGNDFAMYWGATRTWLSGGDPYASPFFITPPASLLIGLPYHWFDFETAVIWFRITNAVVVLGGLLLLGRTMCLSWPSLIVVLLTALFYGPFYSLMVGGNADGVMFALLVAAYCTRNRYVRGGLLGLATGIKLYSGLVAVVLLRRRKWLEAFVLVLAFVAIVFAFGHLRSAFSTLGQRSFRFQPYGNISPALLFSRLIGEANPLIWRSLFWVTWLGSLAYAFWRDPRHDGRSAVLAYIPWMVAAPVLVFRYTAVLMLLVFAEMVRRSQIQRLQWGEWLTIAGFVLTGLYPEILVALTTPLSESAYEALREYWRPLAPVGVLLVVVGTCFLRPRGNGGTS